MALIVVQCLFWERRGRKHITYPIVTVFGCWLFLNLHAHLYGSPKLAEYLSRYLPSTTPNFESDFGVTGDYVRLPENPEFLVSILQTQTAFRVA